jgi:hypothetical protein
MCYVVGGIDQHTHCLQGEREDVTSNKSHREPFWPDKCMCFPICEKDDPGQFHVYACSEEDGCE